MHLFIVCVYIIVYMLQVSTCSPVKDDFVPFSIVHLNDFHARYEQINLDSGVCKNEFDCIGGFSRLYTLLNAAVKANPNSILLNAGDNFEGTLWYDLYKWNVTQYFLNKLPYFDAFTLGNHEFEDGIAGLTPYLKTLKSPVVVANIDASQEPTIQGLFNKSIVIERNGKKIGIIGVLTASINKISNGTGNLVILNESESVNAEAERLVREEGVFTNIVLSHCGYDVEQEMARKASHKISVIVGGHSHTFLYTGTPTPGPDIAKGPYPTVIKSLKGKTVLVVQASSYTKYLGNITVWYDSLSNVVKWNGKPIFIDTNFSQDANINDVLKPWKKGVDADPKMRVVGSTLERLDQSGCSARECLIGNLVTDSMVYSFTESPKQGSWTRTALAVVDAVGLRSGISKGNITYYDLISVIPFNNTVDLYEIKGEDLKDIFEASIKDGEIQEMLQVSGIKVKFNLTKPSGSQVSLKLRCYDCLIPKYENVELDKIYPIAVPSFLAKGGLNFPLFEKYLKKIQTGGIDLDLLLKYVGDKSPVFEEIGDRIVIVGSETG